jgi:hypothetical protein
VTTPFDYMKAMAELWGRGGQDFAAAQQDFFANVAKTTGREGPSGVPPASVFDPQGLTQANQAFTKLWSSALEIADDQPQHAGRPREAGSRGCGAAE